MRRLRNRTLDDALTYIQRTHQQPEQVSTAMLLRFQRDLATLDDRLHELQTSASPPAPEVMRQFEAAKAQIADLERQLAETRRSLDETGRSDLPEFVDQLRKEFEITDLDALYDAIALMRRAAEAAEEAATDDAGDESDAAGDPEPDGAERRNPETVAAAAKGSKGAARIGNSNGRRRL